MCEDLFVTSAEVTHLLVVNRPYMSMKIWPAQSGEVAGIVWTVIAEKEDSVTDDIFVRILYADVVVCTSDIFGSVVAEPFRVVIGEDHKRRRGLDDIVSAEARK